MRILALDSSGLVASVAVVEKIEEEEQGNRQLRAGGIGCCCGR